MKTPKTTISKSNRSDRFADFFRDASQGEKEKVFREAAERANEDQRAIFRDSK